MSLSHRQQSLTISGSSTTQLASSARTGATLVIPVVSFHETAAADAPDSEHSASDEGSSSRDGGAVSPLMRQSVRPRRVGCREMCTRRVPKGKAVLLVFTLIVIERYIFNGAVDAVLRLIPEFADTDGLGYLVRILLLYCGGRIFYPVGGYLADVFLGRYTVIYICLWLYWIAFSLLATGSAVHVIALSEGEEIERKLAPLYYYLFPILCYLCVILASGGFQSTIIPFGADQLEAASSSELSSYIYWYYLAIQVGSIANVIVDAAISYMLHDVHTNRIIQALIAVALISLALILHRWFKGWYFRNIIRENCIKLVKNVVCYAAKTKRHLPRYRRAFRYGEGRVPRIELAKQQYDGIYTQDQVEDVKTFCRICLVLFSLMGLSFTITGGYAMLSYRLNYTLSVSIADPLKARALLPNIFNFVNTLTVALIVPIVNHILVPCIPSMTIKEKIGIGMAISIVGVVFGAYLEWAVADKKPLYKALFFIIPSVILSIQETFAIVSVLEFIFAQSPESMKGMLTGILYFMHGIMSGGASIVFYVFLQLSPLPFAFAYFYIVLLVFSVLGFVAYILVACLYTNHQRPLDREDESYVTYLYNNFRSF